MIFAGVLAVVLQGDFDLAGIADHVAVGHDVAGRIDDKAGTERDPLGLASRHLRKEVPLAVRVLLIEEAAQEFVERRVGKAGVGPCSGSSAIVSASRRSA